jgi:hypothetical protein
LPSSWTTITTSVRVTLVAVTSPSMKVRHCNKKKQVGGVFSFLCCRL